MSRATSEPCLEIKYFLIQLGDEVFQDIKALPTADLRELEFEVTIGIGEIDTQGADDFSLYCLCNVTRKTGVRSKTPQGALKRFDHLDLKRVEDWIRDRVRKCDKGSYDASLPCLRRNFDWEFEGCKPLKSR